MPNGRGGDARPNLRARPRAVPVWRATMARAVSRPIAVCATVDPVEATRATSRVPTCIAAILWERDQGFPSEQTPTSVYPAPRWLAWGPTLQGRRDAGNTGEASMSSEAAASHPLADLYVARALDPVIELAGKVARDFVMRPQQHTRASAEETELLTNFRLLVGKHPEWPNAAQRSFASTRLFARMCQSFAGIRRAAIRYVDASSDSGTSAASTAFVESVELVRATVQALEGAALSAVADTHLTMAKRAVAALGSERSAAAFGRADWRVVDWSTGAFSPQFGYLCESISQSLALDQPLRQPETSSLQRAARYGSATIAAACAETSDDAGSDRLASVAHTAAAWAAALGEILASLDVRRAWEDPAYRSQLSPLQRDMVPPHPSGEVDVEGTVRTAAARFSPGGLGFSTETVAGEICCCTGDLVCPVNTNGQCDLSDDCPTLTEVLIA